MSRSEKVILTNMCMIEDNNGNVLVQRRVKNDGFQGICFPGGHVNLRESFVDSVIREIKEETNLDIIEPKICGIKQYIQLNDERYIVILFKTNQYAGELISSEEGEVFWIALDKLYEQPLAPNFEIMLEIFLTAKTEQYGYHDGEQWITQLF